MSNTLVTPLAIAERMLPHLKNNAIFSEKVFTDYSDEFVQGRGATVKVRIPATFTATDFDGDLANEYQDITETSLNIVMDSLIDTSVIIDTDELTTDLDKLEERVLVPAANSLMQKLDVDLWTAIYQGSYIAVGAAASTPADLSDFTLVRKNLNDQNALFIDRSLIVDNTAEATLLLLDTLVEVDKSGSTTALRQGSMGTVMGLNTFSSNNVGTHTKGTLDGGETATGSAASTTITIASGGNAGTITKGDILTVTGGLVHVATAAATMDGSGDGTVSVYPAIPAGGYSTDAVALTATHTANVGFQKDAIALVSRPLAPAIGGAQSSSLSFEGLNLRVTWGYDMDTKANKLSMDMIYGIKVLRNQHIVRLLG